jgi:hypothetical protein
MMEAEVYEAGMLEPQDKGRTGRQMMKKSRWSNGLNILDLFKTEAAVEIQFPLSPTLHRRTNVIPPV